MERNALSLECLRLASALGKTAPSVLAVAKLFRAFAEGDEIKPSVDTTPSQDDRLPAAGIPQHRGKARRS